MIAVIAEGTRRNCGHCQGSQTCSTATVTPKTEGFQALVWHLFVSHPDLERFAMAWETLDGAPHPLGH